MYAKLKSEGEKVREGSFLNTCVRQYKYVFSLCNCNLDL